MKKVSPREWVFILISLTLLAVVLSGNVVRPQATPILASNPDYSQSGPAPASGPTLAERSAFNVLEGQLISVYETASPSVVHVTNRSYDRRFGGMVPQGGTGTGFVYDEQGDIITNYHVIQGAEKLLVTLADGREFEAEVVGADPLNDLAVIRIREATDLPDPLPLADSSQVRVGQFVIAIGNPFGLNQTLTTGVVSALGRVIQSPEDNRFIGEVIQTDAAINPGNSGGPLLDLGGDVIGVNSQILSPSGASSGIGFSVSSNTVRRVVPALIRDGKYAHPWLGTQLLDLTPALVEELRAAGMELPGNRGLIVIATVPNGPAEAAQVHGSEITRINDMRLPLGGDIIVAIDGERVQGFQDLTVYLESKTVVGDTVELTVIRDGSEITIPVTLGRLPDGS